MLTQSSKAPRGPLKHKARVSAMSQEVPLKGKNFKILLPTQVSQVLGFFLRQDLTCSPGFPGTHYIAQVGPKLSAILLPQLPGARIIGMICYIQLYL